MKLQQYLSREKLSQAALAEMLGVTQSAVSQWIDREIVPANHCPQLERLTNGCVTCEELNDKVDWAYIRTSKAGLDQSDDLPHRRSTDEKVAG